MMLQLQLSIMFTVIAVNDTVVKVINVVNTAAVPVDKMLRLQL